MSQGCSRKKRNLLSLIYKHNWTVEKRLTLTMLAEPAAIVFTQVRSSTKGFAGQSSQRKGAYRFKMERRGRMKG